MQNDRPDQTTTTTAGGGTAVVRTAPHVSSAAQHAQTLGDTIGETPGSATERKPDCLVPAATATAKWLHCRRLRTGMLIVPAERRECDHGGQSKPRPSKARIAAVHLPRPSSSARSIACKRVIGHERPSLAVPRASRPLTPTPLPCAETEAVMRVARSCRPPHAAVRAGARSRSAGVPPRRA